MRLTKGNVTIGVHTRFDLTGRVPDASLRHVGIPSARELFTSAMGAVPSIAAYQRALGLRRAYSTSQRLI